MQAKKLKKLESKAQSLRDKKKNKGNRKLGGVVKLKRAGKAARDRKAVVEKAEKLTEKNNSNCYKLYTS